MVAATSIDNAAASSSASASSVNIDTRFTKILQQLLRNPYPGCIFVQATSASDQVTALDQVRSLTSASRESYVVVECHPNLLGSRVVDLRRDIEAAFEAARPLQEQTAAQATGSTTVSKKASTSSSISIFPERYHSEIESVRRLLVIPSAHLLRSTHAPLLWSQFLHPPEGYTVLLLSSLPLERWRTADALEEVSGTRPIVKLTFRGVDLVDSDSRDTQKALITDALLVSLPLLKGAEASAAVERFKPLFVEYTFSSLSSEVGPQDIEELRFLSGAIWLAQYRILQAEADENQADVEIRYKDRHALLSLLGPLVRGALRDLSPRRVGLSQWIDRIVERHAVQSVGQDGLTKAKKKSTTATEATSPLAPLASLLLISAFLASHLPPRTDTRFFLRDSSLLSSLARSSKKVRRSRKKQRGGAAAGLDDDWDASGGGSSSNSDPLLLGPKPFGLQRMLYIFENLCTELDVALPSFQGEMLAKRKRKRREEEEDEEGAVRSRRLFSSQGEEDERTGSKVDITSLPVQHALLSLVQASYLLYVGPPTSGSLASAASLPAGSDALLLGSDHGGGGGGGTGLPPVPSRLEAVTQVTMRCNVLKEELRTLVLGAGNEAQHGADFERQGVGSKGARKEWWTRLEECGL
ncbi:hypothetical protein BCV69DRAFT_144422 [Microstroma glucosiphilum]|uniref:Origin recognition complex subunit 5 C-terminal domain-containing protein n=1 Tax=Pseudomicrostroma glucosiphilum TaxID=1684307 RepID=A0A316UB61_9BASI|nr:hypothetical protein BCV69DRAFT_144422 [Pseudomicrostroma glucosiphilum]PWN22457.1 hypothetical protein BCV69DRAFT_144422 [Pseudomicrostroma glucosiphilum]